MYFVIKNVHQPSRQGGDPPDRDQYSDMVLCQHMGGAIDINQLHVRGHTCQGGYCQPEYNSIKVITLFQKKYIPIYPMLRVVIMRK